MARTLETYSTGSSVPRFLRRRLSNRRGKYSFVESCPKNAKVLDVGCGNNSPFYFKKIRPDIYYVGLDVADYAQTDNPSTFADEYIVVDPVKFGPSISAMATEFDAIVSAHNLEHCIDQEGVLTAMLEKVGGDGKIYLSFPCQESVSFPSRGGCLNFHDDPTHLKPPNFDFVRDTLEKKGFEVVFSAKRYRPILKFVQGLILEPVSAQRRRVLPGTWALYGFETIIWGRRRKRSV